MIERHYKTVEIAGLLGIAPKTLRNAALRGELHPVRVGGDLIWPESTVTAWLERNRVDNTRVVPLHRPSTTRRRTA